jgi:hypothetical protein
VKAVQVAVFGHRFLQGLESNIPAKICVLVTICLGLPHHTALLPAPTKPGEHVREPRTQVRAITGLRRQMQGRKACGQVRVIVGVACRLPFNQMWVI